MRQIFISIKQPRPHGHMSLLKKTRRNFVSFSSGETYGRGDEVVYQGKAFPSTSCLRDKQCRPFLSRRQGAQGMSLSI